MLHHPDDAGGPSRPDDAGSIVPLVAVLAVVFVLVGALVGATARRQHQVSVAQWAADAAALAAAAEGTGPAGRVAAARLAAVNGANLVSLTAVPPPPGLGDRVVSLVFVVEVEHEGAVALAAAARFIDPVESAPMRPSDPSSGVLPP
ncbi:MAG: hypothetical protein AAGA65_29355 [Actinomycetota bacterium]